MLTTKAKSRTKKRLLEIKDHLHNLNTVEYVRRRLEEPPLSQNSEDKELIERMLKLGLIDDYTLHEVYEMLVDHIPAMRSVVSRCARGNGLDLLNRVLHDSGTVGLMPPRLSEGSPEPLPIARTFELGRTNYTTAIKRPEDKCIFWTFSVAFFVLYYEHVADHPFDLPAPFTENDYSEFMTKYPEFAVRTWDFHDLLQFRLVMKHVVNIYGNGNNKACLVEMVTRITRGREIALTCNTSGGAMKKDTIYNDETEVAAECCRVRIYQRESGVEPRRRDHNHNNDEEKKQADTASGFQHYPNVLQRVPTADIKMIAGLKDAFKNDSLPLGVDRAIEPPNKRHKSNPETKVAFQDAKPVLERRHSGQSQSSGIESILLAAAGENMGLFEVVDTDRPDMSRSISEDINYTLRHSYGSSSSLPNIVNEELPSLLHSKPGLTRKLSSRTNSSGSTGSLLLSRVPSAGDYMLGSPDGCGPPKCSRVTSTDWAQYPYNQLKPEFSL